MLNYLRIMTRKQKFYLFIGVICMISMYAGLADYDYYWQCKLGEAILTRGDFNALYSLTWGSLGISEYLDHEWLTNILFYICSLVGLQGISLAKLLICVAYAYGTVYYLKSEDVEFNDCSMLGICFYVFMMSVIFIKVKAYILSVVFLLVEVVFLRKYKATSDRKYFIFMGILLVLWNNMHSGSMPLFFVVAGVYWLTELNFDRKVAMTLPGYALLTLLNPYGYKLILFNLRHAGDTVMKELVLDWRCIDGKELLGVGCTVLLLVVIFYIINIDIKKNLFNLAMLAIVFVLSLQSARHLIYMAPFFYSIVVQNKYEFKLDKTVEWLLTGFCIGIAILSLNQAFYSPNYAQSYAMDYIDDELEALLLETNADTCDGLFTDVTDVWSLGLQSFTSGAFPCTRERFLDSYEMIYSASDARITELIEKYGLTKFMIIKYNPVITYADHNGVLYDYLAAHEEYELLYDSDFYCYFVRSDLVP